MAALGFNERWRQLVMLCVTKVNYLVLVNRKLISSIEPSRELRQGDPLSPYLFLICVKGLSALINTAEQ